MTLDSLTQGAQRHVQALVDEETRKLATILCLPLVDGVFATLLVTGSISTVTGIFSVALTIFAGAGALAVVLSLSGSERYRKKVVIRASAILVAGAFLVSLIAPIYEQLVHVSMMQKVAALALIVIAGKLLEIRMAEKVSIPVVVVTGLVISLRSPSSISFTLSYVLPAVATAVVASAVLILATALSKEILNVSAVRKGASAVLMLIALPLIGVPVPSNAALLALAVTVIYSVSTGSWMYRWVVSRELFRRPA